jgi:hypothetical protein
MGSECQENDDQGAPRWRAVPAPATTRPVEASARTRFFGGLPQRGPWSAVGLGRGQFLGILGLSIALFVLVGGPVWAHVHEGHFTRIGVSYGVIPLAVAVALHRNGAARPGLVFGATVVIALVKLVVTAGLLVVLALGR